MTLNRIDGLLHFDNVPIPDIAAFAGTPVYAYSWSAIAQSLNEIESNLAGIPHQTCYAVKANSNLTILRKLVECGLGFDVVSGGELERVLSVGGDPNTVVFSGVGKSHEELAFAMKVGVGSINIESEPEFNRIVAISERLNIEANIAFRIHPEIDSSSHPYLNTATQSSKFGLCPDDALRLIRAANGQKRLNVVGLACHVGSQISDSDFFRRILEHLLNLKQQLASEGISIQFLDLGGGFAIQYQNEVPFPFGDLADLIKELCDDQTNLLLEPGRILVGSSGILITKVEYLKIQEARNRPNFAVIDAAMNDLIRPALYDAWHNVQSVYPPKEFEREWDVVGPVCESGDFLALNRRLSIQEDDLLVLENTGAYGFTMSSNYNSRPRPAEILIENGSLQVTRQRESIHDLLNLEQV